MMNNTLILLSLSEKRKNSFMGTLNLGNGLSGFAKIDTGCTLTSIPVRSFGLSKEECKELKKKEINDYRDGKVRIVRSIGVETSSDKKMKDIDSMSDDELLKDESICFEHSSKLTFEDYDLGVHNYKVNYDRCKYGLIGMNIIKELEYYGDYSSKLGANLFLGVLRSREDKSDYYRALEDHFNLITKLSNFYNSENIKNLSSGLYNYLDSRNKI